MNSYEIEFFGLLHLANQEVSAINVKVKNFVDQVETYLSNASLLSKSLDRQGITFTILTNDKQKLNYLLANKFTNLNVRQIDFPTLVPSGVKFYSAHFKVDAFRYIASLNLNYAIFCDLDVVCLKPVPEVFRTFISEGIPLVYDVSDQIIPGTSHTKIMSDLEKITSLSSEGRWIGGEFLAGPSRFFGLVTNEIDTILPTYFENLKGEKISSQGNDEFYTSAAIEILKRKGLYVSDAGPLNLIGRFWSSGTGFVQKPFMHFSEMFLLHLPADKYFLRKIDCSMSNFDPNEFIDKYVRFRKFKKVKSIHRVIIYFLFRVKSKTFLIKNIKFK